MKRYFLFLSLWNLSFQRDSLTFFWGKRVPKAGLHHPASSCYDAGLLLDAINRAKTLYFTNRYHWDEVVQRDMAKDVSWENSARQYKDL